MVLANISFAAFIIGCQTGKNIKTYIFVKQYFNGFVNFYKQQMSNFNASYALAPYLSIIMATPFPNLYISSESQFPNEYIFKSFKQSMNIKICSKQNQDIIAVL